MCGHGGGRRRARSHCRLARSLARSPTRVTSPPLHCTPPLTAWEVAIESLRRNMLPCLEHLAAVGFQGGIDLLGVALRRRFVRPSASSAQF